MSESEGPFGMSNKVFLPLTLSFPFSLFPLFSFLWVSCGFGSGYKNFKDKSINYLFLFFSEFI